MKVWTKVAAHLAWGGLFLSTLSLPAVCQDGKTQTSSASASVQSGDSLLPDSPGTVKAEQHETEVAMALPQQSGQASSSQVQNQPAPPPERDQNQPPQKPVGTAAAEAPNTSGIAASEPAGAAIAPAKQRRAKTIIIRVGALIGAGVAIGAIAALTLGTASKPPGAH